MTIYILLSICCFFSFINFLGIILLSNSLFRFFSKKEDTNIVSKKISNEQLKGLQDVKEGMTYDIRFR